MSKDTWKLYSSTTGSTAIAFPDDANEIQVVAVYSTLVYSKVLTNMNYGNATFNMGGYIYSTTNFGYAEAIMNKTNKTVKLGILMHAGQDQTSSSNFYVFYH